MLWRGSWTYAFNDLDWACLHDAFGHLPSHAERDALIKALEYFVSHGLEVRKVAAKRQKENPMFNDFGGGSNYPPGHPTGLQHGHETEVFYCDGCNTIWDREDLVRINQVEVCPTCKNKDKLERADCEKCGAPATHIDLDRAVNAPGTYCAKHRMGW